MEEMPHTTPVLNFDFRPGGAVGPLAFHEPIEVISALRLEDVAPALARVEAAALGGRWAAGFVSYEAAPAFEPAFRVNTSGPLPLLWFGIFERPVQWEKAGTEAQGAPFDLGEWTPDVDAREYHRSVGVIRDAIGDGRIYQVNYTLRLRAPFNGDPLAFHRRLCTAQGSSYSAYLDLGRFCVLSASPELFFERKGSASLDELEVWYAQKIVDRLPRLRGSGKHLINYRHIIDWLVRKPGAFEDYRYREDLFPTTRFRIAYDTLNKHGSGAKRYLKILELAARKSESAVDDALRDLIDRGCEIDPGVVEQFVDDRLKPRGETEVEVVIPALSMYDGLLSRDRHEEVAA